MKNQTLLLAFASLLLGTATASLGRGNDAEQPLNVVIIYADDLGWGDLACYGHPKFKTPHLDRMAAEGARLTNFYASCPYCAPSRASLMTGRYPFRNGMFSNPCPFDDPANSGRNAMARHKMHLPTDEITLAQVFKKGGYATSCIGKWHLGHEKKEYWPTRRGFDEYFGILYSNDMHPVELIDGENVVEFPVVQATLTKRYTERALKFISANKNKPFFLYLPHAMPHKPLAASPDFYEKTGTGLYGDVVAELDWSVGRILETLTDLKLDDRTLVVFSSDNGPWYGGSTGGLRGMKSQWWEGGIRVPLIARLPGVISQGHVSHEPAIIMDVFVTAAKAAGVALPEDLDLDGRDIMPLLTGDAESPHEALFSYQGGIRTVRAGDWKLHYDRTPPPDRRPDDWVDRRAPNGKTLLAPDEQPGPQQFPGVKSGERSNKAALFLLSIDNAEQTNVAAEHPEEVERLKELVEAMREVERKTRARLSQ